MLKSMVRSVARLGGYEIVSLAEAHADRRCMASVLRQQRINLAIDVGANSGQFGGWIRDVGYRGRILSFEPLAAAHAELERKAAGDPQWTVAPRMALGATPGTTEIHVSGNSASSSLLPMLDAHGDASPSSRYVGDEKVGVRRLDDVYCAGADERVLLKIDVQGYEQFVLEGAAALLEQCRAVMIEMSVRPLYQGQTLARGLWDYLGSRGFEACYFHPGFRDPATGHLLQMDGIFARG